MKIESFLRIGAGCVWAFLLAGAGCAHGPGGWKKADLDARWELPIELPPEWVEDVKAKSETPETLVATFLEYTGLQCLHPVPGSTHLELLTVNLDDDTDTELVGLIGVREVVWLCVIDVDRQRARLVHCEDMEWWDYVGRPSVQLIGNGADRPTFYILKLETKGTGVYSSRYHFYRVDQGRVGEVLSFPARLYCSSDWNAAGLAHETRSAFQPFWDDGILIDYRYVFKVENEEDPDDATTVLEDSWEVLYAWDAQAGRYHYSVGAGDLTARQLALIETVDVDGGEFLAAFAAELGEDKWPATNRVRRAVAQLRERVEQARSPAGGERP